jgi:hypothetical protein
VPDAVARPGEIEVSRVFGRRRSRFLEIPTQRGTRHVQERTEEWTAPRGHSRETRETRAPDEMKQKRLGLVVPLMGQEDPGAIARASHLRERRVPGLPHCRLGWRIPDARAEIQANGSEGDVEISTEPLESLRLSIRIGPHAVVHVGGHDRVAVQLSGRVKEQEKGGRIRSSRDGNEQSLAFARTHVPAQEGE